MNIEVYMPRLGATMKEGMLVNWLKREGDVVQKGESIAEISSEKLTNVIEAPATGLLGKIIVQEGETVPVATVLAIISSEASSNSKPQIEQNKESKTEETNMSIEVYMPRLGATMKEGLLVSWLKKEGDAIQKGESLAEISSEKLTNVIEASSSGFLGKIIVQEGETVPVATVLAIISAEANSNLKPQSVQDKENKTEDSKGPKTVLEVKPLSGLRKVIGERMAESLRLSPQGTMTTRADMSELIALKDELAALGKKVTYTDMLVKIVGLALEKNPQLNTSIEDSKLVFYKSINIGIGVGGEDGLFVPVIKNVEQKNLLQISQELKELALKIKEKRITSEDMTGGTFTISNLGMFDVDIITPIINPPEAAILAIGATRKEAVVMEDDKIVVRPLTTLSLTADHAIMDGIPAVTFLSTIKDIMKNPRELLM